MAIPEPQSQPWVDDRAILLVHGVGSARPGDYDPLVAQLRTILGDAADRFAIYVFYYDVLNDWFSTKTQAAVGFASLVGAIRARVDATALGNAAADFAGDVIWPVLIAESRQTIRVALTRQLRQIVADGERKRVPVRDQHISIIAHSLGCFHTYETLHALASDPSSGLTPASDAVSFDNVMLMAPPIQLIRTVAGALGPLVPQREAVQCLSAPLRIPSERTVRGDDVPSVRRLVTFAGNLDPVAGYFFRRQYAYTDPDAFDWTLTLPPQLAVPEHEGVIDAQELAHGADGASLAETFTRALQEFAPPEITLDNPHAWSGYVERNARKLRRWLLRKDELRPEEQPPSSP